jgi:RND family efflux transporter MFP subunit
VSRAWLLAWTAALACGACHRTVDKAEEPAPVAVRCVAPVPEDVDDVVVLRGRIQPPPGGDLAIASQVAGRLVSVAVREGQRVASGDIVATVDDAPSRDALKQADATLAQARANQANAIATLERARALVTRGVAAKQELDDAQTKADALAAEVKSATAASDVARRTLGRVVVRSSFAGVVTRLWRGPGALVDGTAATPIAQVAASELVEFVADATAKELVRVEAGDAVRVTLVTGESLDGAVVSRSAALDPATGLGSVRIGASAAAASPSPPPTPTLGTFGTARLIVAHRTGVPTLPASALRGAVADGAEVVVCSGDKAALRRVDVGWRGPDRFEAHGLAAGERVAIDHVLGLTDGAALQVEDKP